MALQATLLGVAFCIAAYLCNGEAARRAVPRVAGGHTNAWGGFLFVKLCALAKDLVGFRFWKRNEPGVSLLLLAVCCKRWSADFAFRKGNKCNIDITNNGGLI